MLVALGDGRWDATHRAVVVGVVEAGDGSAARHVADGADALAVAGRLSLDAPVPVVALDGPELDELAGLVAPLPGEGTEREAALAQVALAITRGARVVLTRDVRGARRVADVLAAILART